MDIPNIQPLFRSRHEPGTLHANPLWAYVPPVRPYFKLNLDREETTLPPAVSLEAADRYRKADFPIQESNRYPSKMIEKALVEEIAGELGVGTNNVLIGNGIMNIMTYIYDVYSAPGEMITVPTPGFWPAYTYAFQRGRGLYMPLFHIAKVDNTRYETSFPIDDMAKCLSEGSPICYICNPNNPTGALIPFDALQSLITTFPRTLFILDEAYGSYAANRINPDKYEMENGIELLKRGHQNIIIARTFSKVYALANHRIGYVLSAPGNIETLRAHMGPYDISEISLAMAYYNFRHKEFKKQVVQSVIRNMDEYIRFLEKYSVMHYGGYRNSLLVEDLKLAEEYENNGIAVRAMVYQDGIPNLVKNTFRITIPSDEQNFDFLMTVTKQITGSAD
ncbi:MAG: aminotransferase class I/II-fold pyridoxal phosphate-dependent enzyme [Lewinellaceae bacterium]|nr:aminotransferase class I/II-fold pyridoxal phosphate-dependent enzyme [Lewinellaceae bacterium]